VMQQIEGVLDKSIGASGYTIKDEAKPLDLSRIDFDALRKFFKQAHKRVEIERLRAAITAKLQAMIAQNRTRVDFLEKFQQLIDEYNAGSANVESIYEALLQFAKKLNGGLSGWVGERGIYDRTKVLFEYFNLPFDAEPPPLTAIKRHLPR